MAQYQIPVIICDDLGQNCQAQVWMPSTDIPLTTSWFGLAAGSTEYWDVVWTFGVLMATVWSIKAIVKFIRK